MNLKDKLPKRLQPAVSSRIYEVYQAPTRQLCELKRDELVDWLCGENQAPAAETLLRDWDDFVTFYDYPTEHWLHLRTTDEIVKYALILPRTWGCQAHLARIS